MALELSADKSRMARAMITLAGLCAETLLNLTYQEEIELHESDDYRAAAEILDHDRLRLREAFWRTRQFVSDRRVDVFTFAAAHQRLVDLELRSR